MTELKDKEFSLDRRLNLCAKFVRSGVKIADIGTDHALLPVWLCLNKNCPSAVAADLRSEPLKRGIQTIEKYGLSKKIKTRLSDGLQNIKPEEADDIIIAGMGGELIAKIMSNSPFTTDKTKHYILQPMTRPEKLVKWLCSHGYKILDRDCCYVRKLGYTVILAQYTGEIVKKNDELYYYLAGLQPVKTDQQILYVYNVSCKLKKKAKGDPRYAELAKKILREAFEDAENQ